MRPLLSRLAGLGIAAHAPRLPRGDASRAIAPLREQVGEGLSGAVIGGHSFGARVASLLAAETSPAGLVLLSYPLHRPGRVDELRVEHFDRIACPVLALSGDRDQFARIDLLRDAVGLLSHSELHVYPGLRHGLGEVADDVAARITAFTRGL
jgi:predicted alpha/beta-hydrolase family hydrolase